MKTLNSSLLVILLVALFQTEIILGQENGSLSEQNLSSDNTLDSPSIPLETTSSNTALSASYVRRYPYVIVRPQDRDWLTSLPIEHRPNRPLHFYGNTIRRLERSDRPFGGLRR